MDYINDENEYRKFVFTILFKVTNGLETVNTLYSQLNNKPQFSDTIFISLRALLADKITMDYLLFKSDFKNENVHDKLEWLKYDHIKYTLNNLKIFKSIYETDDKKIQEKRDDLKSAFPNYFDSGGNLKKQYDKLPTIGHMAKEIIAGTPNNSKFQSHLILSFEHYDIYSKYEHLGQLTPYLVFRGYKDQEQDSISTEIQNCIKILVDFIADLITEFHEPEFIERTDYWTNIKKLTSD
ncbi:hypothetical protein N7E81_10420 [Reichenbachiella carrageenanivorans]|uniref:Uncharacterized protein n=1 Tax=Reichenbachiella carrageenanivorans TaxID=2979869 RepID=A0ABY6CVM6_9BACT|nr:hypothetical protein [Reichenbachiella carrageenanivorans]UXX77784.1 hypothetical protein N7E81_10420 [Reichenbachiella carrageenanivorans]